MDVREQTSPKSTRILSSIPDFGDDTISAILARQSVEATVGVKKLSGVAEVRLDLLPRPSIYIYCELDATDEPILGLRMQSDPQFISTVKVDGRELEGFGIEVRPTSEDGKKYVLQWCPTREPLNAQGDECTQMRKVEACMFNLAIPGLPSERQSSDVSVDVMEEINLQSAAWNVRLNGLQRTDDVRRFLRKRGSHCVTHIAELKKTDDSSFSGKEAADGLEALRLFLCLAVGSEFRAVCPVGFNTSGDRVWTQWSSPGTWEGNVMSWFHGRDPMPLIELFPGFMTRWTWDKWHEALKESISWYVSANQSSRGIDGGIIFAQSAIERLAYEYCVCEKIYVRTQGFKALPAADQYRMLLSSLSIPLDIPASATFLVAAARGHNWKDGPQALTQLRNDLVHGGLKRGKWSPECYVEAWKLSLWYLEMALLALCGYHGTYWNRNNGQVETVPW